MKISKKSFKVSAPVSYNFSPEKGNQFYSAAGRTKKQCADLRTQAHLFLMYQAMGDEGDEALRTLGYEGSNNYDFISKHGVSKDYLWVIQQRPDFKQKYWEIVTAYMAKRLPEYLNTVLYGKEASKGIQMLFPKEAGEALATRKVSIHGDSDDEAFRNEFFGFGNRKKQEEANGQE